MTTRKRKTTKRKPQPLTRAAREEEHYAEVLEQDDGSGELLEQVLTHAAGLFVSGVALYRIKKRRSLRAGSDE